MLNKLPRHRRTKVLTALTDLKSIVFLMVERCPDGSFAYHLVGRGRWGGQGGEVRSLVVESGGRGELHRTPSRHCLGP